MPTARLSDDINYVVLELDVVERWDKSIKNNCLQNSAPQVSNFSKLHKKRSF